VAKLQRIRANFVEPDRISETRTRDRLFQEVGGDTWGPPVRKKKAKKRKGAGTLLLVRLGSTASRTYARARDLRPAGPDSAQFGPRPIPLFFLKTVFPFSCFDFRPLK
jgi:hypothetical protein